jgi:hypothetical protein
MRRRYDQDMSAVRSTPPSDAVRHDEELDAEAWNLTRFDPGAVDPAKGHLESTFIKLNDPSSPRALWVKLTIFAPTMRTSGGPPHGRGHAVAETWAIAFDHTGAEDAVAGPPSYRDGPTTKPPVSRHVAVKQTVPVEEARLALSRPVRLEVAGVKFETLSDGRRRLAGEVVHGEARIAFDVTLTPRDLAPLVPFPYARMYEGSFPKTKLVSPIVDALADGEVTVVSPAGTRRWEVNAWPAMQGHNWGTGHADTYAWAHVNSWNELDGKELVLEGFSGRVRLGKKLLTPLVTMIAVRHRGVRYEATSIREMLRTRGTIDQGLRRWTFSARQADATIEGSIVLRTDDTVGLYYPNPNGEMTYCLNSKIAHATLRFAAHDRAPLQLTSDAAALEIGTHDATHGVRMYV